MTDATTAEHIFGSDAIIVITVEYFGNGMVTVRGNLQGPQAAGLLTTVLQGAILAVQNNEVTLQ